MQTIMTRNHWYLPNHHQRITWMIPTMSVATAITGLFPSSPIAMAFICSQSRELAVFFLRSRFCRSLSRGTWYTCTIPTMKDYFQSSFSFLYSKNCQPIFWVMNMQDIETTFSCDHDKWYCSCFWIN